MSYILTELIHISENIRVASVITLSLISIFIPLLQGQMYGENYKNKKSFRVLFRFFNFFK